MIIAFSGWRYWTDRAFITDYIDSRWAGQLLFGPRADTILFRVGDATGADRQIWEHIAGSGAMTCMYPADEETDPIKAGAIRNRRMILGLDPDDPWRGQIADELIAFPQPGRAEPSTRSRTWRCIKQAAYYGIPVTIPGYRKDIRGLFDDFVKEM